MHNQFLLSFGLFMFLSAAPGSAEETRHMLQGLFCNTERHLVQTLADPRWGTAPELAVETANIEAVVCTYVDRLHYVVLEPAIIGRANGYGPVMYEATLVGVVVGGQLRDVTPPLRVFFTTPQPLADAAARTRI
jgi:hypothetical protein